MSDKEEAKNKVLGLLEEVLEVIHAHQLSDEFSDTWMAETESLVYPPDKSEENPPPSLPLLESLPEELREKIEAQMKAEARRKPN